LRADCNSVITQFENETKIAKSSSFEEKDKEFAMIKIAKNVGKREALNE
jgi:hypothetical protein